MWRLCVRVLCLSCARLDAVPFGPWLSVWGYGKTNFRFVYLPSVFLARKWSDWVRASRLRTVPNTISRKHRNKKLLYQHADGSYELHAAIIANAKAMGLMN